MSATSSGWACTSTQTAAATSRSASRVGTPGAGSCTPAAAPWIAGSRATCRRSWPCTSGSRCSSRPGRPLWQHDGRCVGLLAERRAGGFEPIAARGTILATGGMAALWQRTTNPPGATGSGHSLAHAVGADLADLEFVQFHPTALASDGDRDGFLITEAVRGEGATLLGGDGERFVDELARGTRSPWPSRRSSSAVASGPSASICATSTSSASNIVAALADEGIDPRRDLVPVAPAAHYAMGGIAKAWTAGRRCPGSTRWASAPAAACMGPTG